MIKVDTNYAKVFENILKSKEAEIVSFGISDSYVPNWNEVNALTEYIANFYDENNIHFSLKLTENAVILEDNSKRGIKLEDLAFGNSRSAEASYKIGTHGEGFKLGALALIRENKKVVIETIGNTIIFFLEFDNSLQSNILKAKIVKNNKMIGSTVYLETDKINFAKEKFLFLNENIEKVSNMLYLNKKSSQNYIFVNTFASQKIKSIFSYSLHKKQTVNRDRNMLESPYHDLALTLFSSDKETIYQWLLGLHRNKWNDTFEEELLTYIAENMKKTEFKNFDFSILKEVIKENNFKIINPNDKKDVFRFLFQDSKIIFSTNNNVLNFFSNIGVTFSYFDMDYARKDNEHYHIPITLNMYNFSNNQEYTKPSKIINHLLNHNLLNLKILDSFSYDNHKISVKLKKINDINIEKGKDNKDRYLKHKLNQTFVSIYHLFKKNVQVINSGIEFYNLRQYPDIIICKLKELPPSFDIIINAEVAKDLETNLHFKEKKQIVNQCVYQVQDQQQYIFSDRDNEILYTLESSLFSYIENIPDYKLTDICANQSFIKAIFENVNNEKAMRYELMLLSRCYQYIKIYKDHRYFNSEINKIKLNWSKVFKETFGFKSCVSYNEQSDKKAVYNGYKIIKLPTVIQEIFHLLNFQLSHSVHHMTSHIYNIIPKPSIDSLNEIKSSQYYKVFYCLTMLNDILKKVYDISVQYKDDNKNTFITKLLPNNSINNKLSIEDLDSKSKTKELQYFCFELFNKVFIAHELNTPNELGLFSSGKIYIKNHKGLVGTFFHEFIHLSTGLDDINVDFEKMLSFINVMSSQIKMSDKKVDKFITSYQDWLKV